MEGRPVRKDGSLPKNVRGFDECSPKTTDSRETTVDAPIGMYYCFLRVGNLTPSLND